MNKAEKFTKKWLEENDSWDPNKFRYDVAHKLKRTEVCLDENSIKYMKWVCPDSFKLPPEYKKAWFKFNTTFKI